MYSKSKFDDLTAKYGPVAGWAIWSYEDENNTSIINGHLEELHSRFVLLGLNISGPLFGRSWGNFRGGKHDRKLKYASNDTILRGSYITDIFKNLEESHSSRLKLQLNAQSIDENVGSFVNEMKDIEIDDNTQFIVLGQPQSFLAQSFNNYFSPHFPNNRIIYYYHYAYYRLSDKQWVEGLWNKLGIKSDYEDTFKLYKKINVL